MLRIWICHVNDSSTTVEIQLDRSDGKVTLDTDLGADGKGGDDQSQRQQDSQQSAAEPAAAGVGALGRGISHDAPPFCGGAPAPPAMTGTPAPRRPSGTARNRRRSWAA